MDIFTAHKTISKMLITSGIIEEHMEDSIIIASSPINENFMQFFLLTWYNQTQINNNDDWNTLVGEASSETEALDGLICSVSRYCVSALKNKEANIKATKKDQEKAEKDCLRRRKALETITKQL